MRNHFLILACATFTLFSVSVSAFAAAVSKESIPEKVMAQLYKKHPDAIDIFAVQTSHFGVELYEISFRQTTKAKAGQEAMEPKEKMIELYRTNGDFYVNGVDINTSKTSDEMPAAAYENLKATFPNYNLKEAILVVNPNGVGEEYDLLLSAADGVWRVSLNRNGEIVRKEND